MSDTDDAVLEDTIVVLHAEDTCCMGGGVGNSSSCVGEMRTGTVLISFLVS